MHKFSTAATTSSGLLHRLRAPQAGAPVPVGVSRWLTRTVWAAHLCQGGFGFAILAQIIHRLSWRSGGTTGGSALRHVATETPAGVLLQYAEEVEGGGTHFVGRTVRTDDPAAAADSL